MYYTFVTANTKGVKDIMDLCSFSFVTFRW